MADNTALPAAAGKVATREVTYSGELAQAQAIGLVGFSGADDAKTAVDLPGDASNGLDVDVTRLPASVLDTFGKLQAVNSLNDIDLPFFRDDPANMVTIGAANGGTAVRTTGLMQMATSTATNGSISAVSRDTVGYRAGGEVFAMFTTAFLDGGVAGCNQRIGLFDASNGFYIGYEGTTFGIVARTGGVDGGQVAQASWNGDQLAGAAGSRFTRGGVPETINLALLNVWRIRFGWLGAAPVKLEALSPDGEWVACHTIRQPNLSAAPHIQSPDLPVSAFLAKTSGATNVRLNTACWGAGSTYDKADANGSFTLGTAANSVVPLNVTRLGTLQVRIGTGTTGTIIFESSIDGTNWVTHRECVQLGAAGVADTNVTAAVTPVSGNVYRMVAAGYRDLRIRTATTLGAAVTLHYVADENILPQSSAPRRSYVQLTDGTNVVTMTASGALPVGGGVAHDGADLGNPVKMGMRAVSHGATPAAVAAADRTDWLANRGGIPFMIGGHPNIQSAEYFTSGAITDDNILPAIAGGTIYVITQLTVACSAVNATSPSVRIGFGTATLPAQGATNADAVGKVVLSHPGIPPGSGIVKGNGSGIVGIGGDGEELRITCSTPTTSLIVQVDYYTIAG